MLLLCRDSWIALPLLAHSIHAKTMEGEQEEVQDFKLELAQQVGLIWNVFQIMVLIFGLMISWADGSWNVLFSRRFC